MDETWQIRMWAFQRAQDQVMPVGGEVNLGNLMIAATALTEWVQTGDFPTEEAA